MCRIENVTLNENKDMGNVSHNKTRLGGITFILTYMAFLFISERNNLRNVSAWLPSWLPFIVCTYFLGQFISRGKNYTKAKKWLFIAFITILQVIIWGLLHYLEPKFRDTQLNYLLNKPEVFFRLLYSYIGVTFTVFYPINLIISKFVFWQLTKKSTETKTH